jgi:hypothetical protein
MMNLDGLNVVSFIAAFFLQELRKTTTSGIISHLHWTFKPLSPE